MWTHASVTVAADIMKGSMTRQALRDKLVKERKEEKQLVVDDEFLHQHSVFVLNPSTCSKEDVAPTQPFRHGKFGDIFSCASKSYVLKRFFLDDANHLLLRREIDIHTGLRHRNIVPCYGVLRRPDREIGLVLKYCHMDLFEYIHKSQHPLKSHNIQTILRQVIAAMQHLVQQRIVHRDVKPENILLEEHTDKAMLADFGWARRLGQSDWCLTQAGTAEYCPPECLKKGNLYRGFLVDRWALGVLTYELVNGETYFWQENREAVLQEVKNFRQFDKPVLDMPLVNSFCSALMKRKPNHRMTLENAMKHALLVSPPSPPPPPPPPLKRSSSSCGVKLAPPEAKRQRSAMVELS